jgi:hypothetical protein
MENEKSFLTLEEWNPKHNEKISILNIFGVPKSPVQ